MIGEPPGTRSGQRSSALRFGRWGRIRPVPRIRAAIRTHHNAREIPKRTKFSEQGHDYLLARLAIVGPLRNVVVPVLAETRLPFLALSTPAPTPLPRPGTSKKRPSRQIAARPFQFYDGHLQPGPMSNDDNQDRERNVRDRIATFVQAHKHAKGKQATDEELQTLRRAVGRLDQLLADAAADEQARRERATSHRIAQDSHSQIVGCCVHAN